MGVDEVVLSERSGPVSGTPGSHIKEFDLFGLSAFQPPPPRVKKLRFFTEIQPLNFLMWSSLIRRPGVRDRGRFPT